MLAHLALALVSCAATSGRSGYAMTWDGGRQHVVIFGGESAEGRLTSDLLQWEGKQWSCLGSDGPPPRQDASIAWDATRNVLVLYGGRANGRPLRDTWEFTSNGWAKKDDNGPTPEPHGVMGFDRSAGGVLLYSGLDDDTPTRITWRWNGQRWTKVADGPNEQFPNAMVEADGARLMTARRIGDDKFVPALHRWTNAGWEGIAAGGELPSFSPQAPAASFHSQAVLYIGFEPNGSTATWQFDRGGWKKSEGASPPRRKGAHMAFDPVRKVAVLHAGDDGRRVLEDTWEWDGRSWRRAP